MEHKYSSVVGEVALPAADRSAVIEGRGGEKKVPRRYHHSAEKLDALIGKIREGAALNPYRRGGAYWGICEALNSLGLDKRHAFSDVLKSMQEIMSDESTCLAGSTDTAWERFSSRVPRSQVNGRDILQKVMENIEVLQRLRGSNPYGMRLLQLGAVINIYKRDDSIEIEMSTGHDESVLPVNERRKQRRDGAVCIKEIGIPYSVIDVNDLDSPITTNI